MLVGFLLVQGTSPVQAADPSGKLWVERKEAAPKPRRTPVIKQRIRSYQPAQTSSQPRQPTRQFQQRPYDPIRVQGTNTRPNGVQRQTLPPVQNAPIDDQYGRSRGNVLPRHERPRKQRVDLPVDLWRGMRFERFRDGLLALDGVGGSLALNNLVASALLDRRSMPQNTDPQTADLLKMVVLYRMGRIHDLASFIDTIPARNRSLPVRVFKARALLANGERAKACKLVTSFPVGDRNLSPDLLSESLMMTALCAAQNKDFATMGLMADLARDKNIRSPLSYAIMDYLLSGVKPAIKMPAKLGVRDYYFLRLTQLAMPRKLLDRAEPSLVYALAFDRSASPALRLDAAERAASTGQIDASGLAAIYGDVAAKGSARQASSRAEGRRRSDAHTRALLFAGLSRTSDPRHRAKIIDTLLANVRGKNLSGVIGPMLAPFVAQMQPEPDLSWFAMRAVEVALLAKDMPLAERWFLFIKRAGRPAYVAAEWLPLVDLVQQNVVPAGEGTQMALRMARARRLNGGALHRLTSVLDALSLDVPIPLWNTASKQPQPRKGALPPSGVLSALKKMSDEGRAGEVLLLSLQALGSHSADQMHLIALGDMVRSLKKAGFGKSASEFGFEAVYGIWPTGRGRQR